MRRTLFILSLFSLSLAAPALAGHGEGKPGGGGGNPHGEGGNPHGGGGGGNPHGDGGGPRGGGGGGGGWGGESRGGGGNPHGHGNWGGGEAGPRGGGHGQWGEAGGGRPQWREGGGGHAWREAGGGRGGGWNRHEGGERHFGRGRQESRVARGGEGQGRHSQAEARGHGRGNEARFVNPVTGRDHGHGRGNEARFVNGPGERHDRQGWRENAGNGRWSEGNRAGFGAAEGRNGHEFRQGSENGRGFDRGYIGPRYDRAELNEARNGWAGDYGAGRQWMRFRDARNFVDDYRPAWSPLIEGCPSFARYNGCILPASSRAIWGYAEPYDDWYTYPYWYRYDDRYDWRYYGGYLYRVDPATLLISAFLPLFGGALYAGNVWPAYYDDYYVDPYYVRYYGYEPADYDYRYADGAIFAVDRGSHRINTVVALLTGDHWVVGEHMPDGYDFYNVPPEYRDRYFDRDDAWYRYSDGYVYEIDPTTLVVRNSIELLVTT